MSLDKENIRKDFKSISSLRKSLENKEEDALSKTQININKNISSSAIPEKNEVKSLFTENNNNNDIQVKNLSFLNLKDLNVHIDNDTIKNEDKENLTSKAIKSSDKSNNIENTESKGYKTIEYVHKNKKQLNRNLSNIVDKDIHQKVLTTKTSFHKVISSNDNHLSMSKKSVDNKLINNHNTTNSQASKSNNLNSNYKDKDKPSTANFTNKNRNISVRQFLSSPGSRANLMSNPNKINYSIYNNKLKSSNTTAKKANTGNVSYSKDKKTNSYLKSNPLKLSETNLNTNLFKKKINTYTSMNVYSTKEKVTSINTPKVASTKLTLNKTNTASQSKTNILRQASAKAVGIVRKNTLSFKKNSIGNNLTDSNNTKKETDTTESHRNCNSNVDFTYIKCDDLNSTFKNLNKYIDKEVIIESDSKDFVDEEDNSNNYNTNVSSKTKGVILKKNLIKSTRNDKDFMKRVNTASNKISTAKLYDNNLKAKNLNTNVNSSNHATNLSYNTNFNKQLTLKTNLINKTKVDDNDVHNNTFNKFYSNKYSTNNFNKQSQGRLLTTADATIASSNNNSYKKAKQLTRPGTAVKIDTFHEKLLGKYKSPYATEYNRINTHIHSTKNSEKPISRRVYSVYKKEDSKINNSLSTAETSSVFRGRMEDYAVGKEIGKGAYASVKTCNHKSAGLKLAIKIYEKIKLNDIHKRTAVKREIEVLKKIDHHNIVKMHEVIDTVKHTNLIMDLAKGTSLLSYLKSKNDRRAGSENAVYIFRQLVKAVQYCHHKNICHRDIKLENIIIDNDLGIKLIDFGFAAVISKTKPLNFFCGTPSYMPPEIVQKKEYIGFNADVWCLGILLYTLLCGSFPFRGNNEKELYAKICKGDFPLPEYLSDKEKDMLKLLLNIHPSKRPTCDEILNNEYFAELNRKENDEEAKKLQAQGSSVMNINNETNDITNQANYVLKSTEENIEEENSVENKSIIRSDSKINEIKDINSIPNTSSKLNKVQFKKKDVSLLEDKEDSKNLNLVLDESSLTHELHDSQSHTDIICNKKPSMQVIDI